MSEEPRGPRLDELLAARLRATTTEVVERGSVTEEDIDSLERLARLAELACGRERRRQWRVVAVATVVAGALLATALAVFRVRSMEVLMDLRVSEVGFGLARNGTSPLISGSIPLVRFEAAGIQSAKVPSMAALRRRTYAGPYFRAEAIGGEGEGNMELQARTGDSAATVTLRLGEGARTYQMRVTGDTGEYQLVVAGRIAVATTERLVIAVPPDRPRLIRLTPDSGGIDIDFELEDGIEGQLLVQRTDIDYLFLFRDVQIGNAVAGRRFLLSSIDSGTIAFESLNRKPRTLRRGEALSLGAVQGRIRDLRLEDSGISFQFQGRVRGMSIGAGDVRRNLMPTWLEWLSARAAIPFVWGTTLYLLGVVFTALRWWARPR